MKHPTTTSHVCCTHYVGVIPVVTLRSSTIICTKTPQSAFFGVLSLYWWRASMHSRSPPSAMHRRNLPNREDMTLAQPQRIAMELPRRHPVHKE
ncbi:hypothetical protein U9M48_040843 [Paspalum notatum var. saurae]|uniref:Uncharacterized protein n=1 Tax=Paspalum notatum var. saurae TaxID=547442 RepID=A0AAQ3XFZ4_PASNO